jgi:uncharacterized protein (DUF1697 family)
MYIPGAYGRGKPATISRKKKRGTSATMRNFNTLSKLIELVKKAILYLC